MKETTKQKLQMVLEKAIADGELAGGSMLVRKDGKELAFIKAGFADREAGIPIERDQIFRLYSMSKPVAGAAAMKLFEDGMLDLGDPVSKYIPSFKNQMVAEDGKLVPAKREVMVKDLLDMTSGLIYAGNPGLAGLAVDEVFRQEKERLTSENPMTTLEMATELGKCPLFYQPGSSWKYGTSTDVLGAVVEVASGMKFGEYLEKVFFGPLGMKDSGFFVPMEKRDRLVTPYKLDGENGLVRMEEGTYNSLSTMDRYPAYESGGGGLVSTADDYAKFGQMLLNGGELDGVRILKPETVRFMTMGSLNEHQEKVFAAEFQNMPGFTYGNQVRVMKYPGRSLSLNNAGEYGWDGWMGCYFANDPAAQMTIIFMMQRADAGLMPVVRRMRNVIMSELED